MFALSPRTSAYGGTLAVIGALLAAFMAAEPALAQCSSADVGRWVNVKPNDDPAQIDIYFAECGDTVETQTRLGVRVFVRQSSGALYQRPAVGAIRVTDKGTNWIFAKVPTGGYLDKIWMRRVRSNNQESLRVFIRHESLDSKPSASSWHDYRKQ